MSEKPSVALIGAGAMGGALLTGWLKAEVIAPRRSAVFDPSLYEKTRKLCDEYKVAVNEGDGPFDAVVIAVKPQIAASVLPTYASLATNSTIVSVMAGKSIASVSGMLGAAVQVARAMPNLPAAIGKGVTGVYAPHAIDEVGRALIETLMRAAGDVVWVQREEEIDFVTAVSGSGPAYFFLLTEALADAGEALGLSKDAAAALARATLSGAGALMEGEARSPAEMRKAVTSPGGTTEAALRVLDGDDEALRKLINQAVGYAAKRAGELTD